jgi:hypothetical protein
MDTRRHSLFQPEEIEVLGNAYRRVCKDFDGRPQWLKILGHDRMSNIAARAIIQAACGGTFSDDTLAALALQAVQSCYLQELH